MCYIAVFRMFAAEHGYAGTFVPQCQEKIYSFPKWQISPFAKRGGKILISFDQFLYVKLHLFLFLFEKRRCSFIAFYRMMAWHWRSFTSRHAHLLFEISVSADAQPRDNLKIGLWSLGLLQGNLVFCRWVRNPWGAWCCAQKLCQIFPWTSASCQHPCVPTGSVIVALLT